LHYVILSAVVLKDLTYTNTNSQDASRPTSLLGPLRIFALPRVR